MHTRYRWISCVLIFLCFCLQAQTNGKLETRLAGETDAKPDVKMKATRKPKPQKFSANFATISLSFVSWKESVSLSRGNNAGTTQAKLLGNALGIEWEHYFQPRSGFTFQVAYLFGVADVSGRSADLQYQQENQRWWGVGATTHLAHRFSKWAIGSLWTESVHVYRNLRLFDDPSGTSAKASSSVNAGATVDLRMRLTNELEVREEIGTFATNTSTYWSVGMGYKF